MTKRKSAKSKPSEPGVADGFTFLSHDQSIRGSCVSDCTLDLGPLMCGGENQGAPEYYFVESDEQSVTGVGSPGSNIVNVGAKTTAADLRKMTARRMSAEELELYSSASVGLNAGDFGPLATYLRSGYSLHPALAFQLADCIDNPDSFWRIEFIRNKKRGGTPIDAASDKQKIAEVGFFVEQRNARRGQLQVAVGAAMREFKLSDSRIRKMWKDYRRFRNEGRIQDGFWIGRLGADGAKAIRNRE